jgi:hypothetical protein
MSSADIADYTFISLSGACKGLITLSHRKSHVAWAWIILYIVIDSNIICSWSLESSGIRTCRRENLKSRIICSVFLGFCSHALWLDFPLWRMLFVKFVKLNQEFLLLFISCILLSIHSFWHSKRIAYTLICTVLKKVRKQFSVWKKWCMWLI